MIEGKIKICKYPNAIVARFNTRQGGDPRHKDYGTRVKHYVYEDPDFPGTYWHERVWLSRVQKYKKPTYTERVSERKFWGKVRLCRTRFICLKDTWKAVAQCVEHIEVIKKSDPII